MKRMSKIISVVLVTLAISATLVVATLLEEDPTQGLEQMALGIIVDLDYWSDGAYEIYFANLYIDGVPQDIKRHVFSFKDSIKALPMVDQCCIVWGHGHEIHYIEHVELLKPELWGVA